MVSDAGLSFKNEQTLEYIKTAKEDIPFVIQLFGSKIENAKRAIDELENRKINYQMIDLNFGCPVHKVTKTNAGSSWLKSERNDELYTYVKEIVKYSKKPVTAKIRIGFDEEDINVLKTCLTLQKAGVSAITIHPRTAKQMYSGQARYDVIENIGLKLSIPLIISGDINNPKTAIEFFEKSKATAIMVARGAVGNPKLISDLNYYFENKKFNSENLNFHTQNKYAKELSLETLSYFPEKKALNLLKHIIPNFYKFFIGRKNITARLFVAFENKSKLLKFFDTLEQEDFPLNPFFKL